jgi:hypothetical protein
MASCFTCKRPLFNDYINGGHDGNCQQFIRQQARALIASGKECAHPQQWIWTNPFNGARVCACGVVLTES